MVPPVKKYAPAHSYSSTPKVKLVEGFGKGLMSDMKRKAPFLVSDITDGFSIKVGKPERSRLRYSSQACFDRSSRDPSPPLPSPHMRRM